MQQRFLIVSGKSLEEVIETLNNTSLNYARIVLFESKDTGYNVVLDTSPLHVVTYGDLADSSIFSMTA